MNSEVYAATGRISGITVPSDAVVDLHMHTTASDGRFDPPQLARAAHDAGLGYSAGRPSTGSTTCALSAEAAQYDIYVVPAVEVSCMWGDAVSHAGI